MKRRVFVERALAAATLVPGPIHVWAAQSTHRVSAHRVVPIGLQLYTVRRALKTDFNRTIEKIAATGYKEVEFAGNYGGLSPRGVRALLARNGLAAPSAHIGYDLVEKKWPETLEAAHEMGLQYLVCPWIDEQQRNADGWKRAVELFNEAGEASQRAGIQFAYHNHWFEFSPVDGLGGQCAYDYLLAETDPKRVRMEMDLCWISLAGKDPLSYFDRYPGRFPMVHVKDYVNDPKAASGSADAIDSVALNGRLTDVGKGRIDWKRIFAHADTAGIEHYFVENDDAQQPFESIKTSFDYLQRLRF